MNNIDPLLKKTYGERLVEYCENNEIFIPSGFQTRKCHKFAIINLSSNPKKLCALTTYMPNNVTEIIQKLELEKGKQDWLVLDMKRCCTVEIEGNKTRKIKDIEIEKYKPSPI
ncbi:hypothetical protein [Candidatus Thiodiazotropha sp. CDECU1]|uniref:hypothetical protein n=1 Tax=Candidatus Thiodiazotropha sp. CDECU1 TaxID=3065865 RepID=UPI00293092DE|nr:hypothetical protein [Candidatus Thiodiazotropha sp. CDECU1]